MQLSPRTTGLVAVGASAAAAAHQPVLPLAALSALLLMLTAGVVLPAVWSRKPARRQAAAAVLDRLLTTRPSQTSNTKGTGTDVSDDRRPLDGTTADSATGTSEYHLSAPTHEESPKNRTRRGKKARGGWSGG